MNRIPQLVFWEITPKCNLNCPYCRRDNYMSSLSLEESLRIIDSIVDTYHPLVIFSGGEPLLYPYLFEVASHAHKKGLRIALASNGTLIDKDMAERINSIGFHRVAVSLDSAKQDVHDSLRGEGSFTKTIAAIQYLNFHQIPLQINTTVFRRNFKDIHSIHELCLDLKIKALHIFAFIPVGCGIALPKEEKLSPQECEKFLEEIAQLSLKSKIEIKVTCAPYYNRILSKGQDNSASRITKGCLAGSAVCFISSSGEVYPCGYLKLSAGNILKSPFKKIWESSHLFQTLRNPDYLKGKCSLCEYIGLCGGCRARAYVATGNYLEEEPDCVYQPLTVKS